MGSVMVTVWTAPFIEGTNYCLFDKAELNGITWGLNNDQGRVSKLFPHELRKSVLSIDGSSLLFLNMIPKPSAIVADEHKVVCFVCHLCLVWNHSSAMFRRLTAKLQSSCGEGGALTFALLLWWKRFRHRKAVQPGGIYDQRVWSLSWYASPCFSDTGILSIVL